MQDPILYMAPIKGVTDRVFRNLFAEHFTGFDLAVAPFISSKSDNIVKRKYVRDVWPENNPRLPVVPQILSKSGKDFALLANFMFDMGYDSINLNLGCPSPMVANKKRGSGMLPYTDMICWFLDSAVPQLKGRLSIKLRLGWRTKEDILRLMPIFNQYPMAELIIHPRTGVQRYDGTPDLDAFSRCLELTAHPVVYNGDIRTYDDFKYLSQRFNGVGRWMIGRGALVDPFLPMAIKSGKVGGKNSVMELKRFHQALFEHYSDILDGPSHVLNKMKGLWRYFSVQFGDCGKELKKIRKANQPNQYMDLVNRFFDSRASKGELPLNS